MLVLGLLHDHTTTFSQGVNILSKKNIFLLGKNLRWWENVKIENKNTFNRILFLSWNVFNMWPFSPCNINIVAVIIFEIYECTRTSGEKSREEFDPSTVALGKNMIFGIIMLFPKCAWSNLCKMMHCLSSY